MAVRFYSPLLLLGSLPSARSFEATIHAHRLWRQRRAALTMQAPPPTRKLYLSDTYLFEATAIVVGSEAIPGQDDLWSVTLDQTPFHPQGGGQPSDVGTISSADTVAKVTAVRHGDGGLV